MKLKLDNDGHAVLQDGHPVYVHDDGKESPFDAAGAAQAIKARNAEAKQNRERAEAAEAKLKQFEGIDDAEAARKALTTVSNLDAKKLVDAGQVEQLKSELNKTWQEKLTAAEKKVEELNQQFISEVVGGAFARSKVIAEKTVLPPDIAQAYFGNRFKVEGGKLKAVDADGNPILSRKNMGEPAEFDEAIEVLVNAHPHRDRILKASQGSGSGAPSGGGQGSGAKSLTRAQFEQLDPQGRVSAMKEGVRVTD